MKILFIGSGCACRLPFVEYLFKKKIQEAEVPDIEVESADMAMWGVTSHESVVPESSGPKRENGNLHIDAGLNDKAYRAGTFHVGYAL